MELTVTGKIVEEGGIKKLKINSPDWYETRLQKFSTEEVTVHISDKKPTRSLAQNRLLWVYYQYICEETGNTAMEIHETCKRKFLKPRFIEVKGESLRIPGSTKKLNKSEFSEYIMEIESWSGIPCPNLLDDPRYIPN